MNGIVFFKIQNLNEIKEFHIDKVKFFRKFCR